jgi:sugar/nucleoside kinase (ribokinase family)
VKELSVEFFSFYECNNLIFSMQAACRLARLYSAITWFEPVAPNQAVRAIPIISLLHFASPNIDELRSMAAALVGSQPAFQKCCHKESDKWKTTLPAQTEDVYSILQRVCPLLQVLLNAGLRYVVLTLGALGAALCNLSEDKRQMIVVHGHALPAVVKNCSGAGDCLVAGFIHALLHGLVPDRALAWGLASAKRAVESNSNIPSQLSTAQLKASSLDVSLQKYCFEHVCCCYQCCMRVLM